LPDQPQQRHLLVQCGQAAQFAEFLETDAGGMEVNFFAQGDCVVADDDAQDGSRYTGGGGGPRG
jgi:hypothetical protein